MHVRCFASAAVAATVKGDEELDINKSRVHDFYVGEKNVFQNLVFYEWGANFAPFEKRKIKVINFQNI